MILRATLIVSLFPAWLAAQAPTAPTQSNVPELVFAPHDTVSPVVREARSKIFISHRLLNNATILDPPQPSRAQLLFDMFVETIPMPELPLAQSDLVIVGEVTRSQPFVSYSMSSLYTENTIQIVTVIKPSVMVDTEVAVIEPGGKAWYDGRIIQYNVQGKGDALEPGHQYLLFLGYRPEADAYFMYKSWHADNAVLKAAYPDDKAAAYKLSSQNDGKLLSDVVASLKTPGAR